MLASARGKRIVSWIPRQKVLLETDGPFAKVSGQVLFPSDVDRVIQHLSEEWELPYSDVIKQLKNNLRILLTAK